MDQRHLTGELGRRQVVGTLGTGLVPKSCPTIDQMRRACSNIVRRMLEVVLGATIRSLAEARRGSRSRSCHGAGWAVRPDLGAGKVLPVIQHGM